MIRNRRIFPVLVLKLLAGGALSFLLLWLIGAFFCREYALFVWSPELERNIRPPGSRIRMTDEGFAGSLCGPDGSMGDQGVLADGRTPFLLLLGSSFAEGMQVPDEEKLHAVANAAVAVSTPVRVVNVGFSDQVLIDYLWQIPRYERKYGDRIRGYVLLLALTKDLRPRDSAPMTAAVKREADGSYRLIPPLPYPGEASSWKRRFRLNSWLIFAGKALGAFDVDFRPGPRRPASPVPVSPPDGPDPAYLAYAIRELRGLTAKPVWIIWGGDMPTLRNGKLIPGDEAAEGSRLLARLCAENHIGFITLTPRFNQLALDRRRLVSGQANTVPGTGHYNADGHRIAGEALAEILRQTGEAGK